MHDPTLRADCARCAALCCVSLAFDRSPLFAFDKPAGMACPHLTRTHRCAIHQHRLRRGFAGCERYDCLGAGQRVTHELFGGRSWQDDPSLARPMFEAFRRMREVHESLLLLHTAGRLPLAPAQERQRAAWLAAIAPPSGWSLSSLEDFEQGPLPARIRAFLASLRDHVPERWIAHHPPRRRLPVVA